MVVGQDFNTVTTYQTARQLGSEVSSSSTWRNIRTIFPELNLLMQNCFFTNFYIGLRAAKPETGRFPGARDKNFVARCVRFFERQIEVVRPKFIITLGLEPLRAVQNVFGIRTPNTLSACDQIYQRLLVKHGQVSIVPLTHPSLYYANVARRKFQSYTGIAAEREMIKIAQGNSVA
jgi:uracil-DNA glycosylase family 4